MINTFRGIFATVVYTLVLLLAGPLTALAGELRDVAFFSTALNRVATYSVYVPPASREGERFPTLFVLHGAHGGYQDWPEQTNIEELADRYRMVLVFPDGGSFGWYVNAVIEEFSQYETFIIKELVPEVDRMHPTIGTKETRGIMGLSMGGHGALSLAAKHPDLFGSASSLSGILNLTNHPGNWELSKRLLPLEDNRALWEANSAWHLADKFGPNGIRLLFDCGVSDTKTGAITDNRELHERLTALKTPHIYREFDGGHSWTYWQDHLQEHLNFHQGAVINSMDSPERWFAHYYKREEKFLTENAMLAVDPPTSPTLCLVGSSSMEGMPSDLFPGFRVLNRGISADRLGFGTRGIAQRMEESAFDMKPQIVFFKNARNDLSARHSGKDGKPTDDEMAEMTERLLTSIQTRLPGTLVMVGTAFPVRDNYAHLAPSIAVFAERQRALGAKLGIPVIDGHAALIGEDGLLKPEYSSDGLHLSKAGKAIVANMILEVIARERPELARQAGH